MISSRIKQALAPIKNMAIGAGIGLGTGALVDFFMNNKDKEKENYNALRRPLLYAALGTLPGLLQGSLQYTGSVGNKGLKHLSPKLDSAIKWYDPFMLDQKDLMAKSPIYKSHVKSLVHNYRLDTKYDDPRNKPEESLDKKFKKTAALSPLTPNIPVGAMTNSIYNNAGCMIGAPMRNIPNALYATQNRVGSGIVSPAQVTNTLVNAGIGYATGSVIGKTIGALCGISPQTYQTLQRTGMYAGMINTMNNAIQRY